MPLIQSMFVRRLTLIGALVFAAMLIPAARLVHLTLWRGVELRAEAESKLVSERWLRTARGKILDRKGRVLATDRPSYDVAVDFAVLTGSWIDGASLRKARAMYRERWGELSAAERRELAAEFRPAFTHAIEAMWSRLASEAAVPRATLIERRDEILAEVGSTVEQVSRARRERDAALERGHELGEDADAPAQAPAPPVQDAPAPRRRRPLIREETVAHVVLANVSDEVAFRLSRLAADESAAQRSIDEDVLRGETLPGLRILDGDARDYPLESVELEIDRRSFPPPLRSESPAAVRVKGVGTHVLGWMRSRIYREDVDRRPRERIGPDGRPAVDRGHYRPGDAVGATGVEGVCEDELRGLRGVLTRRLDTGEEHVVDAVAGKDVRLTLDAMLQARVQALFDPALGLAVVQGWHRNTALTEGTPLTGAAVVLDVDSGDILALVTSPSFTREQLRRDPRGILGPGAGLDMPRLNRAVSKPYAPGSIVKPLMLCGAIASGKLGLSERITCTGHLLPDQPNILRCWIYKQFDTTHDAQFGHALDGAEALAASCNIFFFDLGRRLGPAGVVEWFNNFAVGPRFRLWDIASLLEPHRRGGPAGDDAQDAESGVARSVWQLGGPSGPEPPEAIQMAIGQGPIVWTPLNAAAAYATLARGGVRILPRLRLDGPSERAQLPIPAGAIDLALRGLAGSVSDPRGTAHHLTYEVGGIGDEISPRSVREPVFTELERGDVAVWAKTGTADASALVARDAQGRIETRDGDHSWTVALVGDASGAGARPRYAIAVVVDFAGSGGRVAGPIVNQIIAALRVEGYLGAQAAPAQDQRQRRAGGPGT